MPPPDGCYVNYRHRIWEEIIHLSKTVHNKKTKTKTKVRQITRTLLFEALNFH